MDGKLVCIVCGGKARRYINLEWCDQHHPNLQPVPDPKRTAEYLSAHVLAFKPDQSRYGYSGDVYKKSKWL